MDNIYQKQKKNNSHETTAGSFRMTVLWATFDACALDSVCERGWDGERDRRREGGDLFWCARAMWCNFPPRNAGSGRGRLSYHFLPDHGVLVNATQSCTSEPRRVSRGPRFSWWTPRIRFELGVSQRIMLLRSGGAYPHDGFNTCARLEQGGCQGYVAEVQDLPVHALSGCLWERVRQ